MNREIEEKDFSHVLEKVLTDVTPNTDNYEWKDLNCVYKPISIIMKSFSEDYFNLFLLIYTYQHIYGLDDSFLGFNWEKEFPLFEFLDKTLKDIFCVQMDEVVCNTEQEFHKNIIQSLEKDEVVLLPGDLFELTYNSMYKRKHYTHYFIIKGYDISRKIYFVLDNMHIDGGASTYYKDFTITFSDAYSLFDANNRFKNRYLDNKNYFWKFKKISSNDSLYNCYDNIINIYLSSIDKVIKGEKIPNYLEMNFIEEYISSGTIEFLEKKIKILNMKKVYLDVLIKTLVKLGVKNEQAVEIYDELKECYNKWNTIKNRTLIQCKKKNNDFTKLISECNSCIKEETEITKKISSLIHRYRNKEIQDRPDKLYKIINREDAYVEINEDCIRIEFGNDKIYDSWIVKDDAPQVLWNIEDSEFIISTSMDISGDVGEPFLCGIVLISSKEKIYFGCHKKEQISVFSPARGEKYVIFEMNNVFMEKCSIKVQYLDNNTSFWIKNEENNWQKIYETKDIEQINEVGFFSKSWEKTINKVSFTEVLVENKRKEKIIYGRSK